MTLSPEINDFWYTPNYVLDCVHDFFNGAYFDPCPINPYFNGLERDWGSNCFINPPYSKELKKAFIKKGIEQYNWGKRFLWLVNYRNSKQLTILHNHADAVCIPDKRIKFLPGYPDLGLGTSPKYDSIFILWGETIGFKEAFADIGRVY